jgi:hypothetical protein
LFHPYSSPIGHKSKLKEIGRRKKEFHHISIPYVIQSEGYRPSSIQPVSLICFRCLLCGT